MSATDQTNPLGFTYFELRFAANVLPPPDPNFLRVTRPWSFTIDTYLDPDNEPYGTTTHLGSTTFLNLIGGAADGDGTLLPNAPIAPYSITAVYHISSVGAGLATFTTSVALIPEPTSAILLGAALAGWGMLARRRRMAA